MRPASVILVLAKAPVPGRVKTRLCPPATPEQSARIAAAALRDTLDATRAVPGARTVVALNGDLDAAVDGAGIRAALDACTVVAQRGDGLDERIAAAHADVADRWPGVPTVQIGMDTPQITPDLLGDCLAALSGPPDADAVLGPATDGGWWLLGLRDPRAAGALTGVPMSRADTGDRTRAALHGSGLRVATAPVLTDVDTMEDAVAVAAAVRGGRFAAVVDELVPAPGAGSVR